MAKLKARSSPDDKLDLLIRVAQDIFILQALRSGIKSHDVATMLKVDKGRVSKISKHLKIKA